VRLTLFGLKGALFYVALIVAFLATPYSNLFFLLLAYLTLQWLSCAVWTPRNLRGVAAELAALEPVEAGRATRVRARLRAGGRSRFQIGVELDFGERRRGYGQADRVAGEAEIDVHVPALPRGVWPVRSARLVSTYPFGVLRARSGLPVEDELIVHPPPVALAPARNGADALGQLVGSPVATTSERQPAALRDYRDGDEARDVHWRASARRGALVVLEQEGTGGAGIEIVLDRRADEAAFERALGQLVALIGVAREAKEVFHLHTQGTSARFGEGQRPWREALRFLASVERLAPDGPEPPPVGPSVVRLPLAEAACTEASTEREVQHAG